MKKVAKTNKQLFCETLRTLFVGTTIEGKGGFVNLYKLKEMYYQKIIDEIQKEVESHNVDEEEIYGMLNDFFSMFDNELYTIFLKDKTSQSSMWDMQRRLYYVKTDIIFQSMSIENNGLTFFFDASNVEHKKNNERRSIVYELKEVKDNIITFLVYYKEGNAETDIKSILEVIGNKITEEELKKVFKKYERKLKQSERDFFIHKDIRSFLQEQFKLWLGEYLYKHVL